MNLKDIKKVKSQNIIYNYPNNRNQTIPLYRKYLNNNLTEEQKNSYTNFFPTKNNSTYIYSKKVQKPSEFNSTFSNFFSNNKYFQLKKEEYPDISNISYLENELKTLKLDYISLNNDNIIFREDINKLVEINKQLERSLEEERSHNYELAKENDILNNENRNLYKKIDEVNQKISQMKSISLNEEGLINKQIYLEEKLNEKEMKCQMILDENNKINSEYKLLNDNYIRLQENNTNKEKEFNELKLIHEEKLNEIEDKMEILMEKIDNLKNENNELKRQNENLRNKIIDKENEKDEYYNKYKEIKIKNEMIKKENEEIHEKYLQQKKYLKKEKEKSFMKQRLKQNNSEHKIKVIQDLHSEIQKYKAKRLKNSFNNEN